MWWHLRKTGPPSIVNDKTETHRGYTGTLTGTRTRGATVTRYATEHTGLSAGVDAGRAIAGRLARAVRVAGKAVAETVSPAGWLVAGAMVAGFVSALTWAWAEGWVLGVAGAALLLLAVPFLLGRHSFGVDLAFDRDRVVAGTEVAAQLEVSNDGSRLTLPVLLDIPVGDGLVEAHVPLLRGRGVYREQITISAAKRGIITVGPMTIGRGDPLGVLRRDHTWPGVQTIYVHPVTVAIPSTSAGLQRDLEGAVTSTIVNSDLSFHAIRDYVPGDSRRHVHWKSTAKTGKLMVRQYEETRRSRIAVVLDLETAQFASEDEFEMAVSCAASLALQAVREGREVIVTTSAAIPEHARGRVHAISTLPTVSPRAMLDGMSGVTMSEHVMPLEQVATMTDNEAEQLSMVFLVTGSVPTLPRLRAASMAFPADVTVTAVRCEINAEPTMRQAREVRVLTVGALHDVSHLLLRAAAS